ncbi:MAG TPA: molybdenum cofactor biosynthesis protein MoaE [Microbacteriaceae bacterium]|nr:molybdenum cofactor biosynthesis protein MoaE [Microbacteriaceae bacterium]
MESVMGVQSLVRLSRIVSEPIDEDAVRDAVAADENGATCLFLGVVRNHDRGRNVVRLDYQAHPDAEVVLAALCAEVAQATGVAVAAEHRTGTLVVGDTALCAAAGSGHRAEAFDACRILVERIKHEVPIWKRQHGADGTTEWVGL